MPRDGRAKSEQQEVDESSRLRSTTVYETIRQEGSAELERPLNSLWWSGIAAGLALSTSLYTQAFLFQHLPDAGWRLLIVAFGYPIGFLIVIFGRLQLFTENTITAILPLLADRTWRNLSRVGRLWSVVFTANLAGTVVSAGLAFYLHLVGVEQLAAALEISRHLVEKGPLEILMLGVLAGFLVAALVWTLPDAKGNEFWLIVAFTWVIGIGDFTHVIVGAAEVFLLVFNGELSAVQAIFAYILPAFVGNVLGGTGLFALIAYAQVSEEL